MVLDAIRPLLLPIQAYLDQPDVTEIMVTEGGAKVFVERDGEMALTGCTFAGQNLTRAIEYMAINCGMSVSEQAPLLEARLYAGGMITARIAAMLPPCAVGGAVLTIRRFGRSFSLADLVANGMLTEQQAAQLQVAVVTHQNILIAGACGVGKTTLLSALIGEMRPQERLAIIEETAEIQARPANVVWFEALREVVGDAHEPTRQALTLRQLFRHSLRHRPDRIILGEVRGPEAYDLLQSLNSGHDGAICTIHARRADTALDRLADCALEAGVGWTDEIAARRCDQAIDLIVFARLQHGRRMVTDILDRRADVNSDNVG